MKKRLVNTAVISTLATSLFVLLQRKQKRPMDPVISPAKYASQRLSKMSGQ
ncbi:MAG TPA: hypothetical protein VFC58_11730 [Desulfosporosinus sp.]|nr:hypothetical protein [Desulfosporosinus sp.]